MCSTHRRRRISEYDVTGSKDLNKDWDAYVAGLDQNNLKRYLEIMQQSYDKSAKQ